MNRLFRAALACGLIVAVQGTALAQRGHAAPPRSAPAPRSFAPSRSIAPPRQAPVPGFNLPRDVNAPGRSSLRAYPASGGNPTRNLRPGPVLANPQWRRGPVWGWNHGVIWFPAPIYWGGGFWGPWALGVTLVLYGSVVDDQDQIIYPSYQIAPSSPGAQLLADYGLQQTPCGPPNLVVIWGPENSVICAYPNNLVAPGNYELDPSTLTIQSLVAPPPG